VEFEDRSYSLDVLYNNSSENVMMQELRTQPSLQDGEA
jgi:ATP-binding cassette subfamily C (CFTR/MRP) protein 4